MNLKRYIILGFLLVTAFIIGCRKPIERQGERQLLKKNGKIAFISSAAVWTINSDGSSLTRLTKNMGECRGLRCSPDGKRFVFVANRTIRRAGSKHEIYVIDGNGENLSRLTNNKAYEGYPCWSPDSKKIAFESRRDGNAEIYVIDTDGKNQTNLTKHGGQDTNPEWSPDGKKIAFVSHRGKDRCGIYVMDPDGKNQKMLVSAPQNMAPAWSPDSKKIAFVSWRDGNNEIYVMDADGQNQKRLTNRKGSDFRPFWSPDGKKIIFTPRTADSWLTPKIDVMNADGTNRVRLAGDAMNMYPCWSPDGKKIVFVSSKDKDRGLYVMDADGKNGDKLTTIHIMMGGDTPVWQPLPESEEQNPQSPPK